MKYGFLLTHGRFSDECRTVSELVSAAVSKGIDAELFVMMDGAYALADKRIQNLASSGVKVTYCHNNAEQRNVEMPEGSDNVQGGIPELSGIMSECDRFFSF